MDEKDRHLQRQLRQPGDGGLLHGQHDIGESRINEIFVFQNKYVNAMERCVAHNHAEL
jgi:hypothetical protein